MEAGMAKLNRVQDVCTIGIDLGDRSSEICVLDRVSGEVMERGQIVTTPMSLRKRFAGLAPTTIVIEVGTHSPWVSRLLQECGHRVLVANAGKIRLIYQNQKKTDRTDAEWLARLGRLDERLLSPMQHRSEPTQADLAMLRSRAALVAARTGLVNHVRGAVKALGARLTKCSTSSFHRRAATGIPDVLRPALEPVLTMIEALTYQIAQMERALEQLAAHKYPHIKLVTQVSGMGTLTGLCFVLTIEDPHRFHRNRSIGPYIGLVPRRDQSGDSDPQLGITGAGDTQLRSLLVQSAHYILGPFGPDSDLRRWGLALTRRGGKNTKRRAVVAVARRLAVLCLSLWKSAQVYEPLRETRLAGVTK